ncbi:MAG: phenylalanine--tRNA ligase subunit alpha [Spirochaetota bacterium]|nr:MAG: phenylalanine--tRNA ligase subunit alpha [Spirochaetota bacterium]
MEITQQLKEIEKAALREIETSRSLKEVQDLRIRYLGRKSRITSILKELGSLPKEIRPEVGRVSNEIKRCIEDAIENRGEDLSEDIFSGLDEKEKIDITEPGIKGERGTLHPITQLRMELEDIFMSMGFTIATGPEIELDYYNFEALNIPQDHPARDIQDTIWTIDGNLLRTHTSSVQIRTMEKLKPPIRIVAPGRVFRYEETNASHEHTFYQVEGLMVDRNISVSNLIAVMRTILREVFQKDVAVRLRPGYFPFVEPGFELDISCHLCDGNGCQVCKYSGWEELLGCGLVHPNVLRMSGIDPEEYSGFAFGMGLDRLVMMRYGIDDIRLFHSGNLRFLEQF